MIRNSRRKDIQNGAERVRRYGRLPRFAIAATVIALVVVLGGCINPFGGDGGSGGGGGGAAANPAGGYGSLIINPGGLSASTIAPPDDLKALVARYDVLLSDPDGVQSNITVADYVEGTSIPSIPTGTWDVIVTGFNASSEVIAIGTPTGGNPFTINEGANAINVVLSGQQSGTGTFIYNLDWSVAAGDVAEVDVTLDPYPLGGGDDETLSFSSTGANTFSVVSSTPVSNDMLAGTLTINDTAMPSGYYYFSIELRTAAGSTLVYIGDILRVFDNLTSNGGTVTLAAGDVTDPPTAPNGLAATLTGDGEFSLAWNDNSNTEEYFVLYENGSPIPAPGYGAQIPAGITSLPGVTLAAGSTATYEIRAVNRRGESTPGSAQTTVTTIGLPATVVPNGVPGAPTWSSPLVGLDWSTMLGVDTYNVYFSTSEALVTAFDPGVRTAGATAGTTAETYNGGPLTPGTTYYWRVEATNATAGGSVADVVRAFTVRDAIYISAPGNTPAGNDTTGDGSTAAPWATIGKGMTEALDGEAIRVAIGTYAETVGYLGSEINVSLTGGYTQDFGSQTDARDIATVNPGVNVTTVTSTASAFEFDPATPRTTTIQGFHVRGGNGAINLSGDGSYTVQGNVVDNGGGDPTATGIYNAIYVYNGGTTTIQNNTIDLGPTVLTNAANFQARGIQSGQPGGTVTIDNNTFRSSRALAEITGMYANTSAVRTFVVSNNTFEQMSTIATPVQAPRLILMQGGGGGGDLQFVGNTVLQPNGGTNPAIIDFSSTGSIRVTKNLITLDGAVVFSPGATFVTLNSATAAEARVDNNVFVVQDYLDLPRAVLGSNRTVYVDHNTMVLEGLAPSGWNLAYRAVGTEPYYVRNNLAYGVNTGVGQPVYSASTTGFTIRNNAFGNYANFYLGGVLADVAALNAIGEATSNYELIGDPALDAGSAYAPTATTPGDVTAGGFDLTGAPDSYVDDFNNAPRSVPVSVGAHEGPAPEYLGYWDFEGDLASTAGDTTTWSLTGATPPVLSGGLLQFAGSTAPGEEEALVDIPSLNKDQYTVAVRFAMPSDGGTDRAILIGGTSFRWLRLRNFGGQLRIVLNNADIFIDNVAPIPNGAPTTFVLSFDMTPGGAGMKVWQDGVLVLDDPVDGAGDILNGFTWNTGGDTRLSSFDYAQNSGFQGSYEWVFAANRPFGPGAIDWLIANDPGL